MQKEFLLKSFEDLLKAKRLLEFSVKGYMPYDPNKSYEPEELESYDAMSFRFEKFVETALSFFVSLELYLHGEKSATLRDRLLKLQRAGYLQDVELWISARLLRSKIARAYIPEELAEIFENVVSFSKRLFLEVETLEIKLKAIG